MVWLLEVEEVEVLDDGVLLELELVLFDEELDSEVLSEEMLLRLLRVLLDEDELVLLNELVGDE